MTRIQTQQLSPKEMDMSLGTILLIVLILILIGALPTWPYSSGWGYYPSGGLGLVVLILLILLLMGRI
jgi:membrane protein YdbS with pleckstrin-like domain